MRNSSYRDPVTGSVRYEGPCERMPGDHSHMPARTEAYLPGDERGHVQASSLGGTNDESNIVPQASQVNHGAYASMERGERNVLAQGGAVQSDKTAFASNQPGGRPDAFLVHDEVTFADGHTEQISHSFANLQYDVQGEMNAQSAALPGTFDAPNPGDGLRGEVGSGADYAALMEQTDAELPGIADDYAPADFSGAPAADACAAESAAEADPEL